MMEPYAVVAPALEVLEPRLLLAADVVISEVFYQSYTELNEPEDVGEEWIELHNRGDAPANLLGWKISAGVDFQFPDATLGAGQYLVVTANPDVFRTKHPAVANYISSGGWDGRLSNSGELVRLEDASGQTMDEVEYADEGDWSRRMLFTDTQYDTPSLRVQGYEWLNLHDGGGKSLELINPAITNNCGQNWSASVPNGGTPGAPNSVAATNIAPLIRDVEHWPAIPRPQDPIDFQARLTDELPTGASARLYYREDGDPDFTSLAMLDNGLGADETAGDGICTATIPANAFLTGTIVEWYVSATDSGGLSRTWPTPVQGAGQVANCLLQVDASFDPNAVWTPGAKPIFRAIMTAADWTSLNNIEGLVDNDQAHTIAHSNVEKNITFIAVDGTGIDVRYQAAMRNRGNGSRHVTAHNQAINFAHDRPWRGYTSLNLNAQRPYSQVLGSAVFRYADLPAADATPVKMLINGVDRADAVSDMYGYYNWLEDLDSSMVANHWPDDPAGNYYKVNYFSGSGDDAELEYWDEDPDSYRNYYNKQTNVAEDDFTDLIHMLDVLNNAPAATYLQDVSQVINVDQWIRDLAMHDFMGNTEGGLLTGGGDDYGLYRPGIDTRFQLMPYDLDSILNFQGNVNNPILGNYASITGLSRLLSQPEVVQKYYATLLEYCDTVFSPAIYNPLVDQVLGGWRDAATLQAAKDWVASRVTFVRASVPNAALTVTTTLPTVGGVPTTTSPMANFSGVAGRTYTRSVTVNGRLATWNPTTGAWSYNGAGDYQEMTLLSSTGAVSYHVPTIGEDLSSWTQSTYNDSSWTKLNIVSGAGLLVTEVGTADTKLVEIQNVSRADINTAGWRILVNDAAGGISAVNPTAWSLPATVGVGQVLYRTSDAGDNYWDAPIDWPATGSGWVMIINAAGQVQDFLPWGYTAAEIAGMSVAFGGLTGITPSGQWSGDGAPVGTTGGGTGGGWVAFNDHIRGTGTAASATAYDADGTSAAPASGPLWDIVTGFQTSAALTITQSGAAFEGSQGAPFQGTDAYDIFHGFVDFGSESRSSIAIGDGDHYTFTFSGLDTAGVVAYNFAGTAVRGDAGSAPYPRRWTLVTLQGAESATPNHSTGEGVVFISDYQVAIWTGHNSAADQGFVAAWTGIDPGPDGEFAVVSSRYNGAIPISVDPSGTAGDAKTYGLTAIRLQEVGSPMPTAYLRRKGNTDGNTAANFARGETGSKGAQNPDMTVPFGTTTPTTQAVGFSTGQPSFDSLIATNVAAAMKNVNASIWTRYTFTGGDLTGLNKMTLRMRYDDGFVAYLNGVEVARRNAANPAAWNVAASGTRDNAQAVVFEDIDITPYLSALTSGTNVLAIQGLNISASDADFLLQAELKAARGTTGVGLDFNPGMNRVVVKAFDAAYGTGQVLDTRSIDVWYDNGTTHIYPQQAPGTGPTGDPQPPATLHVNLITRDSYLPGVPVVVRVEVLDETGEVYRDLWDATATLAVDNPDVQLSAAAVTLYNGLGTALVTFTKSTGDLENFNLTATVNGMSDSDDVSDLTGAAQVSVSGTLSDPSNSATWSGVVHVTGPLTVPDGHTLTVQPGTLVLVDGVASGTAGTVVTVQGNVQSLGTEDSPITWTATTAGQNWGKVLFNGAAASRFEYTNITQAGNTGGMGHTGTGPTLHFQGANSLVLDHVNLTDEKGKVMHQDSGTLDITMLDSVMARAPMGPEFAPRNMLLENTWITDMHRNDDADGIYIHGTSGQNAVIRGGVSAVGDDDGIDTLDAVLLIEDRIIRDIFDKAVSAYHGEVTIDGCLFVANGTDSEDNTSSTVSAKADRDQTAVVNMDHTTIVTTKQAGITDVGIEARWKYDTAYPCTITYHVSNTIVDATRPVQNDYDDPIKPIYVPGNGSVITFDHTYNNFFGPDVGWGRAGAGNINADPLFVNRATHDFRLQQTSPSINAGDPAYALDADGSTTDQGRYTNNAFTVIQGELTGNEIWGPANGQYRISGELTVPAQYALTILAGTTVFFDTGAKLTIRGRLVADGTAAEPIWFTRTPGAGTWGGIRFQDSTPAAGNIIRNAYLQYVDDNLGIVGQVDSELTIENCTFDNAHRRRVSTQNSSLIVRGCTFADTFPAGQQPFDNLSEHIWGNGAPAGGHMIIEGNTFGRTPGHNDGLDIDGGHSANGDPVMQILNNHFQGGGDDAMDLEGDAHIEGNLIEHYHKDTYNLDPGESNAISSGDAHNVGHLYVVADNVFHDVDHAAQVKDSGTMTFANNTVVDCVGAALFFYSNGATDYGHEVDVVNSVFWGTATIFGDATAGGTIVTVNYSRVNAADVSRGTGNIPDYPAFVDPAEDFHLFAGSPAIGAGQYGTTMGGYLPSGASICGGPADETYLTDATFQIGGNAVEAFKWRLNGVSWSAQQAPGSQVVLSGLIAGPQELEVIALNSAGVWQTPQQATSRAWTVNPALSRMLINEVLSSNRASHLHDGLYPDVIELYNDSPAARPLAGWRISDDPDSPSKFTFPAGTSIPAQGRLLLYAATAPAAGATGTYLGFQIDANGEGVYLYNAAGQIVDSIEFGMQIADLSIGRVGGDRHWALNQPTPGSANVAQPTAPPLGLLINEWFTNGDVVLKDDFVELYNPNALPVDLKGLYLTDNPANQKTRYQFDAYNFVLASGFQAITADNSHASGHVDFQLSAKMEILGLFDAGLRQMDRVYYTPQTTDVSQGRTPDGDDTIEFFTLPTPNTGNVTRGSASTTAQTLVAETATKYALVPTGNIGTAWRTDYNYSTAGWATATGAPGGVGFDTATTYLPYITSSLNFGTQMNVALGSTADRNTCYIRIPFTYSGNKADITSLTLNVRYDDGFIAYLNGTQIAGDHIPTPLAYNSASNGTHADSDAVNLEPFDVTTYLSALQQGQNLLAIQAMDAGSDSADFLFSVELVATTTTWQSGGFENLLAVLDDLRITEVMYNPSGKDDTEFIELRNTGGSTLHLGGTRLSGAVDFLFPAVDLAPGEYIVVAANLAKFRSWYGNGPRVAGVYDPQRLSNDQGQVTLLMPEPYEAAILRFEYDQNWYISTDGDGPSLVIRDQDSLRPRWDVRDAWQASGAAGGSPGADDPVVLLAVNSVVINEVLSHSNDAVHQDWIELLNTTGQDIDISGWFLSDDPAIPQKYAIPGDPATPFAPGNTVLPARGLKAFDQVHNFGAIFAFNELGDQAIVSSCDVTGNLGTYRTFVAFDATDPDVSLGRHTNSVGDVSYVAMSGQTYQAANASPRVGPIVIDQIMYNPPGDGYEYILLKNIETQAVPLFDSTPGNTSHTWQLADGVTFTFPEGVVVPAGGYVLVAGVDEVTYRARYSVQPEVQVFGPFTGALSNAGETIALLRPALPEPDGFVPMVVLDSVSYNDTAPWPAEPDGTGAALAKLNSAGFGGDPASWGASPAPVEESWSLVPDGDVRRPELTFHFSKDMLVDLGGVALLDGGEAPLADGFTVAGRGTDTLVVTFNAPLAYGGPYTLRFGGAGVSDLAGRVPAGWNRDLTFAAAIEGDADLDGTVGVLDYLAVKRNYGRSDAEWLEGDFNYDGLIGRGDLLKIKANLGAVFTPPPEAVAPAAGAAPEAPADMPAQGEPAAVPDDGPAPAASAAQPAGSEDPADPAGPAAQAEPGACGNLGADASYDLLAAAGLALAPAAGAGIVEAPAPAASAEPTEAPAVIQPTDIVLPTPSPLSVEPAPADALAATSGQIEAAAAGPATSGLDCGLVDALASRALPAPLTGV